MATKELTAKVKVDIGDAESKLKKLFQLVGNINKAINGKSTNNLEASLNKQLLAAQRVRKATADAEMAELRLASAKEKTAQIAQKKMDAELKAVDRQIELEHNLLRQKQQNIWRAFQAEQAAYERKKEQEEFQAVQRELRAEANARQELKRQERLAEQQRKLQERQRQAEERSNRRLIEQERRFREKQHKEELRRIEKEARLRKQANQELSHDVLSKVKGVLGAYVGVMGLRVVINTSDAITSAENKLNAINGGDTNATQAQMDAMYAAAQRSRTGYTDMMTNVGKSMTLAPDAFKGDINNAIRFQEIMGKTYALGGASAAEQSSSMYQLIQALGAGKLQGDELRSMTEGAPLAAKAIEKYAQELYGTTDALKDMGSEGLITSEIVVAAMMKQGEAVDKAFADTKMTFAQAGQMVKNTATKAFEPALQKINETLNILAESGVFDALASVLTVVGKIVYWVASGFAWVAENWNRAKTVIVPLLVLVGLLTAAMVGFAISQALVALKFKILGNAALMAWFKALWPIFLVIAAIVLVISILNACGISFADMAGYAAGAIWVLISFIITVVKSLWNYLNAVATNIGIAMSNPWEAAKAAFWGWVADIIEGVKWLEPVINAVAKAFGAEGFTLSGVIDEARGKEQAALDNLNYVDTSAAFTDTWADWSVKGAFNEGFDWASNGVNSIGEGLTNWEEKLGKYDAFDDIVGNTGDTAGNTGKMADSMELTEEDLAYLKDVANMEWKKEFTTANIIVDMNNTNTINNKGDLDGWVVSLRNMLAEELSAVANGVYA